LLRLLDIHQVSLADFFADLPTLQAAAPGAPADMG